MNSGGTLKFELDVPSYATKANLKGVAVIDTSMLASKTDLASLKTKVDDMDVDKSKNVLADLSKLSNIVDHDVVKITVYDKLVIKVNTSYT